MFEQELAENAQSRWALAAVESTCGLAARKIVAEHLRRANVARRNLLNQVLAGVDTDINRAYLIIEVLASTTYTRTLWPTMRISDRDVRNKLRMLCPDFSNVSVSGWGYRCTYNPGVAHSQTLPMLVHGFGVQKEVDTADPGWAPFITSPGSAAGKSIASPVRRSLQDPRVISNLVLSCSLLSNVKCSTASPIGWILNAPVWNIFGFAPRDLQFPNDTARTMSAIEQAKGISKARNNMALTHAYGSYTTLAPVIAQTQGTGGESQYNEVVVLGTSKLFNTTATVTGIFVKVCTHMGQQYLVDAIGPDLYDIPGLGFYQGDDVINAVRTCSPRYNLPIVPVVDQTMADRRTDRLFATTFNGMVIANGWNCPLT
ncbi:hypothetical protein [Paraburkholderia nodosa]|uniref:hypothetical protein n=1 Tax=Paraburkholderia nodosa TaxID=392320 RepID=UPI0004825DEB|nr:hypothetical protein [Paraburkholderia nodosa]